jgi:hypothetical protein
MEVESGGAMDGGYGGTRGANASDGWATPDGGVRLTVEHGYADHEIHARSWSVVDGEGGVLATARGGYLEDCRLTAGRVTGDRVLFRVEAEGTARDVVGGSISGPMVLQTTPPDAGHAPGPSFRASFWDQRLDVNDWSGPWVATVPWPGDPPVLLRDDVMFLKGKGSTLAAWAPDAGLTVFPQATPGDAVSSFGTDGVDLVWIEGSIASALFTSPYTTTASGLQPRRVTSVADVPKSTPLVVGCGYAAFEISGGIRIVRLSDGGSFTLSDARGWSNPVALTCSELFAHHREAAVNRVLLPLGNLVRQRLDALGPAAPAE